MAAGITLGAVTPAAAPVTRAALVAEVTPEPATATMRLIGEPPPPSPPQPPVTPAPAAPPVADDVYVVQPGDHLWAIAERVIGERLGRAATDAEVVPYWRALIDLNRPPNPDLIFAGERLRLPD
jgi:nucleoid-associated protein YgaU